MIQNSIKLDFGSKELEFFFGLSFLGEFLEEEWGDTWDTERFVDDIKEVPMNIETSKLNEDVEVQPEIKSEDFMNFVNGEYDIETLELMQ